MSAYLFTIIFGFLLGAVFAWVVFYRWLHKNPTGAPKRLTETNFIPQAVPRPESITQRLALEKANLEKEKHAKSEFMQRLVTVFYGRLESYPIKTLSVCFWEKEPGGFKLSVFHSSCKIQDNVLLSNDFYLFSKKSFYWSGRKECPLDFYVSEEQVVQSAAGVAVSGGGSLMGYVTIDSAHENAFDDSIRLELKNISEIASIAINSFRDSTACRLSNSIFSEMVQAVSEQSSIISKDNALYFISGILSKFFHSHRAMIITMDGSANKSCCISAVLGENQNELKGISFEPQENALLCELLEQKTQRVIRGDLQSDPYTFRFYDSEPRNFELKSIVAVATPKKENTYPLVISLESKESNAYSDLDEKLLTYIVSNVGMAISVLQRKTEIANKDKEHFSNFDSKCLGDFLNHFEVELNEIRKLSDPKDGVGVILISIADHSNDTQWQDDFFNIIGYQKRTWQTHLAMLGLYDFLLLIKNTEDTVAKLNETTFPNHAEKIIELLKKSKPELNCSYLWISAQRVDEKENFYGTKYFNVFSLYVSQEFRKMSKKKSEES